MADSFIKVYTGLLQLSAVDPDLGKSLTKVAELFEKARVSSLLRHWWYFPVCSYVTKWPIFPVAESGRASCF